MDSAQVVSRGVDWITATATREHNQHVLYDVGVDFLAERELAGGDEVKRQEVRWYKGYGDGSVFVGKRDDSVMLRGSSVAAHDVYRRMYATHEHFNITRLDLQVTGRFQFDYEAYGREAEAKALATIARKAKRGPGRMESHRGNGRGDTCSFGARSSQRYLRIYDKTREQRNQVEANLWRWEIEYKHPLSTKIAEHLATVPVVESVIVDYVRTEFQRKGVTVPWDGGPAIDLPTTGVSATNDGRRVVWLNTQVKPVVSRLRESVGLEAVLVALGLDDLLQYLPAGK
jgi:hypothetical protein